MWTPVEKEVVHTLHGHVLEGMRRKAEGEERSDNSQPYQPGKDERRETALPDTPPTLSLIPISDPTRPDSISYCGFLS